MEVLAGCREPKDKSAYTAFPFETPDLNLTLWVENTLQSNENTQLSLSLSEIGSDLADREIVVVFENA